MKDFFNITKVNDTVYSVQTKYNQYRILLSEVKGTGIYLCLPDSADSLIKTYKGTDITKAINYIWDKTMF